MERGRPSRNRYGDKMVDDYIRFPDRDRQVDTATATRWRVAENELTRMLDELDAGKGSRSVELVMLPIETADANRTVDEICHATREEGPWSYLVTTTPDADRKTVWAMPSTGGPPQNALVLLYADLHTRMTSWLLAYGWRASQLAVASGHLADGKQTLPTAALVRPLVETSAAFFCDARKLADVWAEVKATGQPGPGNPGTVGRARLMEVLDEITWGAKFDAAGIPDDGLRRLPSRTNVLTQIKHLSRATDERLRPDYQWLCNTVHPSVGTTMMYAAPAMRHVATHSHYTRTWSDSAVGIYNFRTGEFTRDESVEYATANAAIIALESFSVTWDAAVRVVDDFALTIRCGELIKDDYWRKIVATKRNEPCPCRSGLKAKKCPHDWDASPPAFPSDLGVRIDPSST